MLIQAAGLNVDLSLEQEILYHSLGRDGIVGGYVSFTAKPGTYPFKVLPGPGYGAVTTLILSNQRTILSVSVVADSLPNADYDVAVDMIRNAST